MISVSESVLAKINNPIQLPSNQGDPQIGFAIINESGEGSLVWTYADYIKDGTITSQLEDYIYSCSLTFIRGDIELDIPNELWVPGSKIVLYVGFGTHAPLLGALNIFTGYIDEIDWSDGYDEFTVSATGSISHCLKESSMGETTKITGMSHEVTDAIMEIAGVTNYYTDIGDYEWTYTFKPSDDCLSALEQMYPIFPKDGYGQPGFGIIAGPTDRIVFGYWRDRVNPQYDGIPCGTYSFTVGTDTFSRSIRMSSDKCYCKVRATGKAADGVDLVPCTVDITNFEYWNIPANKIYHANFNGYTHQDMLEDWAETIALELQHQGITDELTGPFRPQITVGDIAAMTIGNVGRQGVITSITHHIGINGFSTNFSVESSGVSTAISGWSSNMKFNGYNKRQNLVELVREITEETTTEALNYHDPISFQDIWDEEEEEEKVIIEERNKTTYVYDSRNRQNLSSGEEEEEEEEPEE